MKKANMQCSKFLTFLIIFCLFPFCHSVVKHKLRHIQPFISNCYLHQLGDELLIEKFIIHDYENTYCELLPQLLRQMKNNTIRMLEIGFGCGHITSHGRSAVGW